MRAFAIISALILFAVMFVFSTPSEASSKKVIFSHTQAVAVALGHPPSVGPKPSAKKLGIAAKSFKGAKAKWAALQNKWAALPVKRISDSGKFKKVYYQKDGSKISKYAVASKYLYDGACHHEFMVSITPAFKIEKVIVYIIQCKEAYPIESDSFLSQFKGKGLKDKLIIGQDVQAVTRSTDSSRYAAAAARAALDMVEALFK